MGEGGALDLVRTVHWALGPCTCICMLLELDAVITVQDMSKLICYAWPCQLSPAILSRSWNGSALLVSALRSSMIG
jgi:hypothetical protein